MAAPSTILRDIANSKKTPPIVVIIALLLLRVRTLRSKRALDSVLPYRRLSPSELAKASQQLYTNEEDGSKTLLVPFRGRIKKVEIKATPTETFAADKDRFPILPASHKPNVDRAFMRQLLAIMRITFPSLTSKEVLIVLLHSVFLVLRTVLSVGGAKLDGRIVRDLVSANGPGFIRGIGWWFAFAVPSTYTNSMIRHLQSKLSLRLRTRLTRYTHDLYLSSSPELRYYRISQPGGLEGVDQYITSDIAAFCESLSSLYGNVMKPTLDMFIFTAQLSRSLGFRGTVLLFVNYYITVRILRAVTPAFGRLAAVEAMLEGEYRTGMNRIGRESEEVAFYGGGGRERTILWTAYLRLLKHINSIFKLRIAYEWTEDFVIKYLWSAIGYGLISIPVLFTRMRTVGVQTSPSASLGGIVDNAVADRTESYISSRRLLVSLADAGGRLMYAYKDVLELAGLTTRLYTLLSTLHNIPTVPPFTLSESSIALDDVDVVIPDNHDAKTSDAISDPYARAHAALVRELSIELSAGKGEHLLITGTNGVGKTAVARVLAGLWAPASGDVTRPARVVGGVFVVPQRSYMVVGTLLDQVIYPHSYAQFVASGCNEADLLEILRAAHLAYLPEREGGWATRKEWRDVLSGGEKQRMGLARVFYHRPKFAVLDECTSAVSSDVEGSMYEHAKSLGITLITISLRPSLAKYHTRLLTLNGDGRWSCTRVGTAEERMGIDRELVSLEAKLAEVQNWEGRVKELNTLLNTPSAAT